jgi:hypothetical protein
VKDLERLEDLDQQRDADKAVMIEYVLGASLFKESNASEEMLPRSLRASRSFIFHNTVMLRKAFIATTLKRS